MKFNFTLFRQNVLNLFTRKEMVLLVREAFELGKSQVYMEMVASSQQTLDKLMTPDAKEEKKI